MDELDTELLAVQDAAFNGFWPALAVAFALIDEGMIEKARLLEFIEALRDLAAAWAEPGRGEDAVLVLQQVEELVSGADLEPGRVLQELRTLIRVEALIATLKPRGRPRRGSE
ncbi:hypothetical protein [Chelatococcus sp. XZ-Ab1]|uniref:hypothetical protein n=1 Tax=Chelatococcus sp. XZ-Ab1 TaxID=3034027 RepID=UPI0023E4084F|nr:hypothetical protein [Chelatococcus sp. XZ-Ab1]